MAKVTLRIFDDNGKETGLCVDMQVTIVEDKAQLHDDDKSKPPYVRHTLVFDRHVFTNEDIKREVAKNEAFRAKMDLPEPPPAAQVTVIVNAQKHLLLSGRVLTYDDIVALCQCGRSPKALHSIIWTVRGNAGGGIIAPGESVTVVAGLIISAAVTDNA